MNQIHDFFWLASFPRSGNTFVRNILYDVFGLESGTYDMNEDGSMLEPECFSFPVVKTHMLPSALKYYNQSIKAVYLIRDGRDAMVSIAHHRSNIIAPGSDFLENMRAAIHAEKGSFFGGWSQNVTQWLKRADLLIRYEDLIADPVACIEKVRMLLHLPEGDYTRIPGFETMKYGKPRYGSGYGHRMTDEERTNLAYFNFRKGKAGNWKEEMPDDLHDLFWSIHGDTMLKLGYNYNSVEIKPPNPVIDWELIKLSGEPVRISPNPGIRTNVLIEAGKTFSPVNDGVKRYQNTLLKEFLHVGSNPNSAWNFSLFVNQNIIPLKEAENVILKGFDSQSGDAIVHNNIAFTLRLPRYQERILTYVPKTLKEFLTRHRIMILHRIYDLTWEMIHKSIHWAKLTGAKLKRIAGIFAAFVLMKKSEMIKEADDKFDLIHLPLQHHYIHFRRTDKPIVVTVHDFTHKIFPRFHTPANVKNAERGWRFSLKRSSALIAVSRSTESDARRFAKDTLPPVYVVHEAIDRSAFHYHVNSQERRDVCRKYGIPDNTPFFLTLSSIEPRKNLENIIAAFFDMLSGDTDARVVLVIAGKKSWGTFHPHTITGFDPTKVIFTGFVNDADLPMLYSEALAFCYVSHYEGFGLPLLEAMNCGTPVIYGNNSSMPEIAGDAGLAAEAADFKSIAQQIRKLFYDPSLRNELHLAALKRATLFSTRLMAEATLNTYIKAIR